MGKRLNATLGSSAAAVIVAGSTLGVGRAAFELRISGEVARLFAASTPEQPPIVTDADLDALPEPVQRWVRYAGVVGREYPATVRLKQEGELRLGDRGWFPFTAEEYYTTDPPGFIWITVVTTSRLFPVVGRDQYVGGKGSIDMRLLGLVPVARDSSAEMDQAALLRYLNEIMWFPAGAISPYITWEAIDPNSARATMTYAGERAQATFTFDAEGRLATMVANRFDREAGTVVPWSTPISAYGEFGGVRIPVEGEAVYARDAGDYPYIRVRITALEHNCPERY